MHRKLQLSEVVQLEAMVQESAANGLTPAVKLYNVILLGTTFMLLLTGLSTCTNIEVKKFCSFISRDITKITVLHPDTEIATNNFILSQQTVLNSYKEKHKDFRGDGYTR